MRSTQVLAQVKSACLFLLLFLAFNAVTAQTPYHNWSKRFGDSGGDSGQSLVVDDNGNLYVAGYFTGTINLGGSDLTSWWGEGVFLVKYDASGAHVWSIGAGETGYIEDRKTSIAIDASGNLVMAGNFQGGIYLGGDYLYSEGEMGVFLAKFDEFGNHIWSGSTGGYSTSYMDRVTSLALDGSGNVFIAGHFQNAINFGGADHYSEGEADIFLAKFDPYGNYLWSLRMGGAYSDEGNSVAADFSGNVYITGGFRGSVNFGGGDLTSSSEWDTDIFLAKYDANGQYLWSKGTLSSGSFGKAITVDSNGNILLTGYFAGGTYFDYNYLNDSGILLAKLDPFGNQSWANVLGGQWCSTSPTGSSVVTDDNNNVYLTGFFCGPVVLDGFNYSNYDYSHDNLIAKYDTWGQYIWSKTMGGSGYSYYGNRSSAIALDEVGNVFITGYFSGTANFGGNDLSSQNDWDTDIFLAKYSESEPSTWYFDADGDGWYGTQESANSPGVGWTNIEPSSGGIDCDDNDNTVWQTGVFFVDNDGDGYTNGTEELCYGASIPFGYAAESLGSDCNDNDGTKWQSNTLFIDNDGDGYTYGTQVICYGATVPVGYSLTSLGIDCLDNNAAIQTCDVCDLPHNWSKRLGGTAGESVHSIATDGDGNVYITGAFSGNNTTANFGGSDLTSETNNNDLFLAKYDASGNHIWSKRFGGVENDLGRYMVIDGSGNVYVTGSFNGATNLGGSNLFSAGGSDIFLVKYDAAGNHIWSKSYGGISQDHGYALAIDGSNNVFITGFFNSNSTTVNFGGGNLVSAASGATGSGFIAKLDASGNHIWSRSLGGTGSWNEGSTLAVDESGNVIIAGYFTGTANFGGGNLVSTGSYYDVFLAKYDVSGNHIWSKKMGGNSEDGPKSLVIDGSGNLYLAGFYSSTNANFGGSNLANQGSTDIFFAKYDASGNHIWSKRMGGTGMDGYSTLKIALDGSGNNVYMTGSYSGKANFGGCDFSSFNSGGNAIGNMFFAKYDNSGNHIWSKHFTDTDQEHFYSSGSLTLDASDNVYVAGSFRGTVNFGGNDLASMVTSTGNGTVDVFLAKFSPDNNPIWYHDADGDGWYVSTQESATSPGEGWTSTTPAGEIGDCDDGDASVWRTAVFFVDADDDGFTNSSELVCYGASVPAGYRATSLGNDCNDNDPSVQSCPQSTCAQPIHNWSKRMGVSNTTQSDRGNYVVTDSNGNVYITGTVASGMANFGGDDFNIALGGTVFLAKYDASGNHIWSKAMAGTNGIYGSSLVVDSSGNLYISSLFSGTVNFGGSNFTSAGGTDVFLVKYDSDGNHIWSKRFGGTGNDWTGRSNAVAIDGSGNLYLTGAFESTINLGGGNLTNVGLMDMFLAKFDASGNHIWSMSKGGTIALQDNSVAVDGSGNAYVTGSFRGTANFGGGNFISASSNQLDVYLAKYDASGNHLWSKRFGGIGEDKSSAITTDGNGNVFITGYFNGTVNFGIGDVPALTSAGGIDMFIAKYDASGNHLWSMRRGGTGSDSGRFLVTDSNGDVYVSGAFQSTVNFGGCSLVSVGSSDVYITKLDESGNLIWSKGMGGSGADSGSSLALDGDHNVYVTGHFVNTADFGGGGLSSLGNEDIFLAKYGQSNPIWYLDADGDGWYVDVQSSASSPGEGWTGVVPANGSGDCDDDDMNVWQSASLFIDSDGDGYTNGTQIVCFGTEIPVGFAEQSLGNDCNDSVATINPASSEVCGNGVDDNCNGQVDEGCGACTGFPAPGNSTTTETLVCPGVPFTIGISNTLNGTNYSYVFQQAANSWGPWTSVQTGGNSTLYVASISSTVWYRVRVNCLSSGQTGIAAPVQVSLAAFCGPSFSSPSSAANTDVVGVTVNGNFRSTDCSANAPGPGSQIGVYGNYLTLPSLANLVRGADGTFAVEVGSCGPDFNSSRVAIYIDFNQDGVFDAFTEEVYEQASASTGPDIRSGTISVPLSALTGNTIMRVIVAEGLAGNITPSSSFVNGEVEDHILTIVNPAVANDYITNATTVITAAYPSCSANLNVNLSSATNSPESQGAGNDVWYTFIATTNAVVITLTGSSNMAIELHHAGGYLLTEDAVSSSGNEILIYDNLTPGQQYWLAVEAIGTPSTGSICFSHLRRSGCDNPTTFNSPCLNFKNIHTSANVYNVIWDDNGLAPYIATSEATGGATLHSLFGFAGLPPMTSTVNYLVRVDATYFLQNAAGTPVSAVVPGSFNCTRTVTPHPNVYLRDADAAPNVRPANAQLAAQQWICATFYEWNFQQHTGINGSAIAPMPTLVSGAPSNRFLNIGPLGLVPNGIYKVNIRPHFNSGAGNIGPDRWLIIAGPAGLTLGEDAEGSLSSETYGPSMLVYPNPTNSGMFTIALRDLNSENALVRVIDQTGRTVVSREHKGLSTNYATIVMDENIAAGIYSVEVVQDGSAVKRTLVVTH